MAEVFFNDGTTDFIKISHFKHELISPIEDLNLEKIDSLLMNRMGHNSQAFIPLEVTVYEEKQLVLAKKISPSVYETIVSYRRCTCNDSFSNTKAIIYTTESKNHIFLKQLIGNRVLKHQLDFNHVPQKFREFFKTHGMKYDVLKSELANFNL